MHEKQTEGERLKVKICKEKRGAKVNANWGLGQGGDRLQGRKERSLLPDLSLFSPEF